MRRNCALLILSIVCTNHVHELRKGACRVADLHAASCWRPGMQLAVQPPVLHGVRAQRSSGVWAKPATSAARTRRHLPWLPDRRRRHAPLWWVACRCPRHPFLVTTLDCACLSLDGRLPCRARAAPTPAPWGASWLRTHPRWTCRPSFRYARATRGDGAGGSRCAWGGLEEW